MPDLRQTSCVSACRAPSRSHSVAAALRQAVDIKMWTLVTEGYPEFVAYAAEEYKKTHPDVNIVYESFPNEAYKTHDPGRAHRLRAAGRVLQLGRRGCGAAGARGSGARHHRPRQRRRRLRQSASRQLAVVLHVRRQATTACRPTPSPSTSTTTRRSSPRTSLTPPTDLRRPAAALPRHPRHRPGDRAVAARQFRALEAQPRHHHAERARARRRGDRGRLCADGARRPALHQPRLCRGLAEGARPQGGRLLPGRAERHLAGGDALDVRRRRSRR